MGIKFKDKTSVGVPAGGDIAEREIHLDLKNGSIYSSSDGVDIVSLGGGAAIVDPVTSSTVGNETRIPEIVEMTQLNYDALGVGRPNKLYIIVG